MKNIHFCNKTKPINLASDFFSQAKNSSQDGLLLHSEDCDMEDPSNVFPNKISSSTLKRGSSSKRTFLLKEKRESIV